MEGEGKIMVTLRWGKKKMLWVQCFLFLILKLSSFYPPARACIAGAVKSKAWSATSCLQILLIGD